MHKKPADLRDVLRKTLANKAKADALIDAILELQAKYDALLEKLDSDTGVSSTNYKSSLKVEKQIED